MKYFLLIFSLFIISCNDDNIVNTYDDSNFNSDLIGTWQKKYFKNQMNLWFDSDFFNEEMYVFSIFYTFENYCIRLGSSVQDGICTYEFNEYYIPSTLECVDIINFDTGYDFPSDGIPDNYDCEYDNDVSVFEITSQEDFEENYSSFDQLTYTESGFILSTNIDIDEMPFTYTTNYVLINDSLLESSTDITEVILQNFSDGIQGYLQGKPAKGIKYLIIKESIMKLLIPPPIQALLSAIMMCLISRYFTHANFSLNGINIFALIFLIIAVIIIVLSMYKFRKIKTTISPLRPNKTSSLVNTGIYEYTRNPMYLGLLLMLFSTALFLKNLISFLIIPLFILFITKNQILPEEEALENIFGEEYKNYKKKVRRWI